MIINQFDLTTPKETDPLSEADNEIRSIKTALLETFPNFDSAFTIKFSDWNKFATSLNITTDEKVRLNTPKYTPVVDSKRLYVNNSGVVVYTPPLPPLGSVIKTVLTLAQLDTIYGAGVFVYFDGASTENTNIFKFTSPNAYDKTVNINIAKPAAPAVDPKRTYFMRGTDLETALEAFVPSSLGAPVGGMSTTTSTDSHRHKANHGHTLGSYAGRTNHNFQTNSNNANNARADYDTNRTTEGPATVASVVGSVVPRANTGTAPGHTHAIDTFTGDIETRPVSITLNFYLRVN